MEYRTLGASGVRVSALCLGAMMFGPAGNDDEAECAAMIHRALDSGINFIDTADRYSLGISEEIVGRAIRNRRDEVVLATKFYGPMGEDINSQGGSRRWVTPSGGGQPAPASVPTTSTCTRCIGPIPTPISATPWLRSPTWCGRARSA